MKVGSADQLKQQLLTKEKRSEVASFNEVLRNRLGGEEGYLETIVQAGTQGIDGAGFSNLASALDPFVLNSRPGHDVGHVYRDMMTALAIITNDPFVAEAHGADALAGLLGGIYHDVAVAVSPMYNDREYECGHAEVGAWLFYQVAEGIICEPLRALVAYAISAHTQYTRPVPVKAPVLHSAGWERPVYQDNLFTVSGTTYRVAVWLTRFADRLDNNGISHFARHVLAMADEHATEGAQGLSDGRFFDINDSTLVHVMTPEVMGGGDDGAPSTLKHMLVYRDSNFAEGSPYNKNDSLFPFFGELIAMKAKQVDRFVEAATTYSQMDPVEAWEEFEGLLRHISQSVFVDEPIAVLKAVWDDHLTDEQRARWGAASLYGRAAYDASLGEVLSSILRVAQSDIVIAALPTIVAPLGILRR